jgi:hypothetical protein
VSVLVVAQPSLEVPEGLTNYPVLIVFPYQKQPTHALNGTTPLFNIHAPTCFGSSLPSSGSFLDSSELLEMLLE